MKKYLAEAIGTMVLVLMGCGAAVSLGCNNGDPETVVGTAIAFGLAVVAMAYTIGGISGCHINPAITLGVFLSGRMSGKDAGMYIVFQVIGAIVGSLSSMLSPLLLVLREQALTTCRQTVPAQSQHWAVCSPRFSSPAFSFSLFSVLQLRPMAQPTTSQVWPSVSALSSFTSAASVTPAHQLTPHVLSVLRSSRVAQH